MPLTVYLADLRYNYSGVLTSDCMPLGIAYMKAVMDRDLPEVTSRLFVYPDKLWAAMSAQPPDILMVTNYMWCEELSFHFAKLAKRLRRNTLVVMGGPNIPLEDDRKLEYVSKHPEIDVYVLGEGDLLAAEVVRQFADSGALLAKFRERVIPSSIYRLPDGQPVIADVWDRHKEIDEIPSAWLTGIQDEFFDGKLAPLMETNRGCPFTCTFCVQGTRWYTKVHNFSKERIREEIQYVARKIREKSPTMQTLRIADSNYGMFERDIEISSYIGETQAEFGWPMYIDATTGKNRPDRIIKSLEKVSGALVLYQAVQSLDENVLRNIKRSTIKLGAYEQLQVEMAGRGLRSNSDLILGLPGETLDTHMAAIRKLLTAGVDQVTNFQLMLLKGSELEMVESRQSFSFKTRFRILPKSAGIYGGEKVMDIEEIVVETDTLTFDDYIKARKYALASITFWHDNTLIDVVRFAQSLGIGKADWLDAMAAALDASTGVLGQFLDDFVAETTGELFPTREACLEFYMDENNFARLLRGEIGDNVMHKYLAISSFHIWPHVVKAGMDATKQLLLQRGATDEIPDFEEFWQEFGRFETYQHAYGHTIPEILASARTEFRYDITSWIADHMPRNTRPYKFADPEEVEFSLTKEGLRGLRDALDVWTTDIKGLTKMVRRIRVEWQVRESRRCSSSALQSAAAASQSGLGSQLVL